MNYTSCKIQSKPVFQISGKRLYLFLVILLYVKGAIAQKTLEGKWADVEHPEKKVVIHVASDNAFYGTNEKGFVVLKRFIYDSVGNVYNGTLINPDNSEEFKITLRQSSADQFNFAVKKFFLTKRFLFARQPR